MIHRPRRHQPRATRRLHPCQVLAKLLDRPEEERLEEYRVRWRAFDYAVESHRAELGRRVDALAEAEHRLLHLGTGQLRPEERAARIVELAERAVLRYWRDQPCRLFGGRLLPRLTGGAYFAAGPQRLHWFDLPASLLREALEHELPALLVRRRSSPGSPDAAGLALLLEDMIDGLRERPERAVQGRRFQRTLLRLTRLAVRSGSPATREVAVSALETLVELMRGDGRSQRGRRRHDLSPSRRRFLARRREQAVAVAEEREQFKAHCAGRPVSELPPPLVVSAQIESVRTA